MTTLEVHVIGGIDTHKDTHHASVIAASGQLLGDRGFPATARGHRDLLGWVASFGIIDVIGAEGTGSYGSSLTRFLTGAGLVVIEASRPNRQARRRDGKSDQLDSEQAARAVLAGTASASPKTKDGPVEVIADAAGDPLERGESPHPGDERAACHPGRRPR